MKTISNLPRLWRALTHRIGVKASPITVDGLDLRVGLEPLRRGRSRAIGKQIHDLTSLQINDDGPVVEALSPSPLIDASDPNRDAFRLSGGAPLETTKDRRGAGWHAKLGQQPLGRSTTCAMPKQPDDPGQAGCPAFKRRRETGKPPCKNLTPTSVIPAPPAGDTGLNGNRCSLSGQIRRVRL